MVKQPISISIVAWITIISGIISFFTTTLMRNNPMAIELMEKNLLPISVQYVLGYIGITVMVVCGSFLLKGENWSRIVYVTWNIIGFTVSVITSPMKTALIPGLVFFLVICYLLFSPKANSYFKMIGDENDS